MNFRTHTLENGLEIVAECNAGAYSQGLGFFVRTGARDETDAIAGVSHFLEHMVFKGTPSRSADDVNREFDELGAHYNAFTSEESTVYYASVLPEYQEPTIDLLADIMRPSLREEDFEMEKKVIVEEIQMYADQPPFGMDDKIKELHYGNHALSRSVLGTVETVEALTAQQMLSYFQSRYSPSNLFVAAAGNIDFEALIEQVAARCGDWPAQTTTREILPPNPSSSFHCIQRETATQQYVLQLLDAPASESADRYAAKLLATMFGDDSGSRLYWELVDPGLAESASLGHYEYLGLGMYFLWMSCEPEDAPSVHEKIVTLQQRAQADGFTAVELRQAQSKIKARIVLGSERPRNRLFNVGGNWMQRKEYRSVADDLQAVEQVTLDDVHRVISAYPLTTGTIVTIGPLAEWPSNQQ